MGRRRQFNRAGIAGKRRGRAKRIRGYHKSRGGVRL